MTISSGGGATALSGRSTSSWPRARGNFSGSDASTSLSIWRGNDRHAAIACYGRPRVPAASRALSSAPARLPASVAGARAVVQQHAAGDNDDRAQHAADDVAQFVFFREFLFLRHGQRFAEHADVHALGSQLGEHARLLAGGGLGERAAPALERGG